MKKNYKLIKTVNRILPIIFIVSLLAFSIVSQYYDPYAMKMPITKVIIGILGFSVIYFVVLVAWTRESKSGKEYEKFRLEEQKNKFDNQIIDELKGTNYYKQLPKYEGKNSFGINKDFWRIFFSIILPLISIAYTFGLIFQSRLNLSDDWMFWQGTILTWCCTIMYYYQYGFKKVIVTQYGVSYKKRNNEQFIPWDKIKTIGVSISPSGRATSMGYVFFSKKQIKGKVAIQQPYENKYTIVLKYRPRLVHCILKYWDKKIVNLDTHKGWLRYLSKLY